ncbi:MAG TPA: hypothetical protein VKQ29_12480 [Aliidongia sp.]|nr:hypothetical protein [Aliidongia sp.]
MWRSTRLPAIALLAFLNLPALAQEAGGVFIPAEVLESANVPVITPPGFPFTHSGNGVSPNGPPNVGSAASRQAANQQLVAQNRGDGGFLEGFLRGQPLAASVAPPPPGAVPVIINNTPFFFNSQGGPQSVDFGTGNIVQQQVSAQPTAGNVGQSQAVNFGSAAGSTAAPGVGSGTGSGGHRGRGNVTNGGGNTVIAGTNATAQQQVLTIAGPRLPLTPITQQQGH